MNILLVLWCETLPKKSPITAILFDVVVYFKGEHLPQETKLHLHAFITVPIIQSKNTSPCCLGGMFMDAGCCEFVISRDAGVMIVL